MPKSDRTVLFIRCSRPQAEKIRAFAENQNRTISAQVLKTVLDHIAMIERLHEEQDARLREKGLRVPSR